MGGFEHSAVREGLFAISSNLVYMVDGVNIIACSSVLFAP
jgi:hypothetical protein